MTIRDVAHAAHVSTTTVSDALSGRGRMSTSTRDRVNDVAAELGYVASAAARNLRLGRSGTLGLYVPERTIGFEYYMHLWRGAAEAALREGFALTILPAWRHASQLRTLHLDAVIVSDPSTVDPAMDVLRGLPVPLVTCEYDLSPEAAAAAVIEIDHASAVTQLISHLHDQGARTVAALLPPPDTGFGRDLHGAFAAVDTCRVDVRETPLACDPDDLSQTLAALLADPPDAIVCVPDGSSAIALDQIMASVRVPDDLLYAAYTDTPSLSIARPSVTAIDIQPWTTGALAVDAALRILAGERGVLVPRVATQLRVRQTTARRSQA